MTDSCLLNFRAFRAQKDLYLAERSGPLERTAHSARMIRPDVTVPVFIILTQICPRIRFVISNNFSCRSDKSWVEFVVSVRNPAIVNMDLRVLFLRDVFCKSDAAFGGCGFFVGARRQSASPQGVCVTYGKVLLLVVSQPSSYGKMVPLRHPTVKPYPSSSTTLPQPSRLSASAQGSSHWQTVTAPIPHCH